MALQHARGLDDGVGAHEAAYQGVVHAPVHMHQAHLVQVLVHREAAVGGQAHQTVGHVGQAVEVAPLAPGVVGQAFDHGSGFVADGGDGAELVVVEVAQADDLVAADGGVACGQVAAAGDVHGKDHATGAKVVLVLGDAVGFSGIFGYTMYLPTGGGHASRSRQMGKQPRGAFTRIRAERVACCRW